MIRTLLYLLTALVFLLPVSASAVGTDFYAVTEWNNPIPTQFYSFGNDIVLTGTWQLPLDWAGHIYVFVDGVQKSSKTGDPYIAIKNLSSDGATATTTGPFNFNIGPQLDGNHTVYIEFWGGEECAINAQLNSKYGTSFTPTCPVVTNTANDNFLPKQIYPSRVFSVGLPPFPRIVITPATDPSLNFANIVNGTTDIRSITITNTGGQTLTGQATGFALPFRCYGTPICDYVVTPGGTKTINVQFVPDTTNSYENTLTFTCAGSTYACDYPTLTRRIVGNSTGAAVPPQVLVTPNPINFGTVNVGASVDRAITVKNSGGGLLVGEVTLPGNYVCIPNCGYSLYSGETVPKTIRFTPISGSGARTDVATFNGGVMQNVDMNSVVNDLPIISVTPSSYTIPGKPNVGGPPYVLVFYVRNVGSGLLSGSVLGLPTPGNTYTCISNCTYANLAPGAPAWPVTVHFNPVDDVPNPVTMEYTNNLGSSQFVTVTGTGNILPIASYSAAAINFGDVIVGASTTRTFTISNTGVGILSLTPSVTGNAAFTCDLNCGLLNIAAGTSQVITLKFAPTATGTVTATLAIPGGPSINLTGRGVAPSFMAYTYDMFTWNMITFDGTGAQVVYYGTSTMSSPTEKKAHYYYLNNTGSGGVNYRFVGSAHFVPTNTLATGCPLGGSPSEAKLPYQRGTTWVNVGGCWGLTGPTYVAMNSTTTYLEFRPSGAGTYEETVAIEYSFNGLSTTTLPFTARGIAIESPYQTVTPSYVWYPDVNVGTTATTAVIVKNEGTGILNGTASFERYDEFYNRTYVPPAAPIPTVTYGEYAFACVSGCTYSLPSGASQEIIFSFAPTTTMTYYGYVRFNSNGGDKAGSYHSGRGIYQPIIKLTPDAFIDLGSANLGTYKEATIRIENTGLGLLNGTVSFTSGVHFSCQPPSTGCAYSIPAGGFKDITVRFSPLTTGMLDTFANFNSNAINGAVKSVQVHGLGKFAPIIDIRGGGTEFGSVVVGRYKDQQVTIRNVGTVDFAPGFFDITGPYECIGSSAVPPFNVNGKCNYDLPAGGETTITVRFAPLVAGPAFGTAALSGVPIANFPLTGYGMAPAVKFIEN